jgi:Divergent InlB B-repeat domain
VKIEGGETVAAIPSKPLYNIGDAVTLIADPAKYYRFATWKDGPTNNTRSIVITPTNDYTAIFFR